MAKSVTQLVQAANAVVPRIAAAQAQELIAKGGEAGVLVVDVREASEVQQSGKVGGAVHVPRGLLEFVADPQSPSHDPRFETGKPVIVYCAGGGRAALAGQALKEMGYGEVYNLGGFADWADSGGAVDPAPA
jgi:rhodanese-related sulfurtransferase